ncbi:MAG: peptidylprolyl isomerase, partial [Ilumatobacteraceae bacterium]
HPPHPVHCPVHFGWWVPHSEHTWDVFTLLTHTVWPTGVTPPIRSGRMATPFPLFDGSAPRQQQFPEAPEMGIDPAKRYTATMSVSIAGEAAGEIVIALDAVNAPVTVNNFVFLALHHYFDGIIFHRIINGFVCQGGDPTGTGRGGPGYRFDDELPKPGQYQIGSLAMANAGPNTNGSQFFLISGPSGVQLPPLYSLFGQTVKGLELVERMQNVPTAAGDRPTDDVVIESVTISVAD